MLVEDNRDGNREFPFTIGKGHGVLSRLRLGTFVPKVINVGSLEQIWWQRWGLSLVEFGRF